MVNQSLEAERPDEIRSGGEKMSDSTQNSPSHHPVGGITYHPWVNHSQSPIYWVIHPMGDLGDPPWVMDGLWVMAPFRPHG